MWKNNAAAPGAKRKEQGAGLRLRSQGLLFLLLPSANVISARLGPAARARRRGRGGRGGSLTFHGILLGSHDVDEGALQGVHVQAVVHSGAVLQNTRGGDRKQRCEHPFPF